MELDTFISAGEAAATIVKMLATARKGVSVNPLPPQPNEGPLNSPRS